MKIRKSLRHTATAGLLATLALSVGSMSAQTLTYNASAPATPPTDGAGAGWDTSTLNWFDGVNNVVWPDTTAATAIFGVGGTLATPAAGLVTVGTVNVGTIQFNTTVTNGYNLSAGTITLGTGITLNSSLSPTTGNISNTISARITGTNGLALNGTGTGVVNLSGATNDYTGITTLSGGTARINVSSNSALGSSAGASASTLGTDYTEIAAGNGVGLAGDGRTVSEAFIINGSGTGSGSNALGALRFVNSNITVNSLVRLGSDSLFEGAFSTNSAINGNIELQSFTL